MKHSPLLLLATLLALPACGPDLADEAGEDDDGQTDESGDGDGDGEGEGEAGGDGNAIMPTDGTYELVPVTSTHEPMGCRVHDGDEDPEEWLLAVELPAQDGPFIATETYGPWNADYQCEREGLAFSCSRMDGFDYGGVSPVDADVSMTATLDVTFDDDDRFVGQWTVSFSCEGTDCAEVAEDWTVNSFPCASGGELEASLSG